MIQSLWITSTGFLIFQVVTDALHCFAKSYLVSTAIIIIFARMLIKVVM